MQSGRFASNPVTIGIVVVSVSWLTSTRRRQAHHLCRHTVWKCSEMSKRHRRGPRLLDKYQKKPKLPIAATAGSLNRLSACLAPTLRSYLLETRLNLPFSSRNLFSAPAISACTTSGRGGLSCGSEVIEVPSDGRSTVGKSISKESKKGNSRVHKLSTQLEQSAQKT